jgi:threonyl-tRNA synthetase
VVGDREIEAGTAAVRDRSGKEVRGVPLERFVEAVEEEARSRALEGVDLEALKAAAHPDAGPA